MPRLPRLVLAALLLLSFAACERKDAAADLPWVSTPELAIAQVPAKPLFYSPPARPWLISKRPELLAEDDRAPESPRVRAFAEALQNPKQFRQLDREHRFAALLLAGDPSQSRPLVEHLLETRDWKLAYLDHAGIVFRREVPEPWQPKRLDDLRTRAAALPPPLRAKVLAQAAAKLVAVRELAAVQSIIEEAQTADPNQVEVWTAQSNYRMVIGEWRGALASAERALRIEPESPAALGCMAQSLYASKRFDEAFAASTKLLAKLPEEPGVLFFHAKIAHEAKRWEAEANALKKLIALAQRAQRPVSGYRVYLGQSYASMGERDLGIVEFEQALADPDLPEEQRKFAEECVSKLVKR